MNLIKIPIEAVNTHRDKPLVSPSCTNCQIGPYVYP
ncbi:hypothetical protein B4U80_04684 [Leptotrombidium deliense]|uniref:Uncharacterized protein n=1 Tax=Leptotrombidium deliense TaxID=299467 RepID=A0A443S157_9ACAR|nr:hypothetical protein B4U80_04684 [Leptotrombidium deliense]